MPFSWFRFVVTAVLMMLLLYLLVQADAAFNQGWLLASADQWQWWNYLTTDHGLTMLYLQGCWWWFIPPLIFSLLGGAAIARFE